MSLNWRERKVLEMRQRGLSDYKIARKISLDPSTVTRTRKNATRKLKQAKIDLKWAKNAGVSTPRLHN